MKADLELLFSSMANVPTLEAHTPRSKTATRDRQFAIIYTYMQLLLPQHDFHHNILLPRAADIAARDRPARDVRHMRIVPQHARAAAAAHTRVAAALQRVAALHVPCTQSQHQQARSGGCKPASAVVSPLRRL